jgi:hypothetical protein
LGHYILNAEGAPVPEPDLQKWARWFATANRRVAQDMIDDVRISTVFLGLDHRFGHGPPLLYETMVFGGGQADEMWRYSTREEALAGHRAMAKRVFESMQAKK